MSRRDFDEEKMNPIQRDRYERRMATRRKSMVTNIVVGVVILAVIIAIIVVAVNLLNKPKSGNTDPTDAAATTATIAQPTETSAAATQPTQAAQQQDNNQNTYQQETQAQVQYSTDVQIPTQSQYTTAPAAPVSQAGVLHYSATGQTSYGYDWTYSGGGGIVSVTCNYDFNTKQYDFAITGVSEGTASLTLYYNIADGVSVPVPMTVSVDSNLNVTQIG